MTKVILSQLERDIIRTVACYEEVAKEDIMKMKDKSKIEPSLKTIDKLYAEGYLDKIWKDGEELYILSKNGLHIEFDNLRKTVVD